MKRIELFKKTGIYFTAIALSTVLGASGPVVTALAADSASQTVAVQAQAGAEDEKEDDKETIASEKAGKAGTNEVAEPEPDDDDGGSDHGDSGDSGSEDSGSGSDDSGSGNSGGGSDDSGSGDSGSGSDDSGSGDSGGGSDDSGSGHSGGGSDDSGSGDSGSGSDDSGSGDSGSGSGDSGSGAGQDNSGDQKTDTSSETASEQKDATATTTPQTTTSDVGDNTPVTIPDQTAKTKKQKGSIKDRQTQLNPGEVPTGYSDAANHNGTNEQLLASQNIVSGLGLRYGDFRFYTVKKDLALAANAQAVHEEMKSASRQIGILSENDAMYILSEEKDGWLYVESGTVRGFVKEKQVLRDEAAEAVIADLQSKLDLLAELSGEDTKAADAESLLTFAQETVPAGENAAFAYKRCTTKSTVIDKAYAVAESDAPILEQADSDAREIGHLYPGNLAYVILQANDKWAFVESGNVRGFTRISNLTTGKAAKKLVQENGEANMATAEEYVSPKENEALYYSLNSVYDGVAYSNIRSEIVNIAAECIGNPYVWGGNSLTYGADCSGFVKTLYSMFGYDIPRVADAQSRYGTQIPISDAAPGDLIFFAANGYVYHVALYAGDGMTIEAYSENRGIIATTIGNRDAVWATRIIED